MMCSWIGEELWLNRLLPRVQVLRFKLTLQTYTHGILGLGVASWELTYPLFESTFESMIFLFPKVGYVKHPRGHPGFEWQPTWVAQYHPTLKWVGSTKWGQMQRNIPAPLNKGCQLSPKGWWIDTTESFGTLKVWERRYTLQGNETEIHKKDWRQR